MKKGSKHKIETRQRWSLIRKGRKLSEETKKKMSVAFTGRVLTDEWKKKLSEANKGKHNISDETRIKMKKARLGKSAYWNKGSCSNFWKGGVTKINATLRSSMEYRLWRGAVFVRDNRKCIWCGSGKDIEADHIKKFSDYPELRFAIDNGRTLCRECHKNTDTYGNKGKLYV